MVLGCIKTGETGSALGAQVDELLLLLEKLRSKRSPSRPIKIYSSSHVGERLDTAVSEAAAARTGFEELNALGELL
jgi:hypothetical protein